MSVVQKPRINDIARTAKVSAATVSRVLHNHANVNPETRQAVQAAIRELNYVPNNWQFGSANNKLIGVMVSDIRNPFFSDLIYLLQEQFMTQGYAVVPFNNEFDCAREKQLLQVVKQQGLAALVLVSAMDNDNLRQALSGLTCPVTLIDRVVEDFSGSVVIQDNFQAGYIATKYLVDLGYHEIAFLAGDVTSTSSNARVEGYRKALSNAFLTVNESLIMRGKMGIDRGYRDGLAYLERLEELPRALLMANDMTAIGFIEACKERNIRIPEDISIVSFDGIALSGIKSVNLTTVRQPIEEMTQKICELTVAAIQDPDSVQHSRVFLEPTLIIRGSACENMHTK